MFGNSRDGNSRRSVASLHNDQTLLRVRDLTIRFQTLYGAALAVDRVSFGIERGEILGLVGESGSGKSATALALMGLLHSPPASVTGRILLDEVDLLSCKPGELRKLRGSRISMVFQEPMTSLDPVMQVGNQVSEAIRAHQAMRGTALRRRVLDLLDAVGIPHPEKIAQRYPHELSGGMKQRVMLAVAISCEPDLIIADEPTTALDPTIQAQVLELMKKLQKEIGSALLLITHDLAVVAEVASRVIVMYAGRIVEQGPVRAVIPHPEHPYTKGLLRAMPSGDVSRAQLQVIKGNLPSPLDLPAGCRFHPRCPSAFDACKVREPPLITVGSNHISACWLHESTIPALVRPESDSPDR